MMLFKIWKFPGDKNFIIWWSQQMLDMTATFYNYHMINGKESDKICDLIEAIREEFT